MGFFADKFLNEERTDLLNKLSAFQCQINNDGVWLDCKVKSRQVIGNYIVATLLFDNTQKEEHTITNFRVLNTSGEVVAQQTLNLVINATQTVLVNLKISYHEV